MPIIDPNGLKQALEKQLSPIYAVYGEELLVASEAADQIKKAAQAKGYTDHRVLYVNGQLDETTLIQAASSPSLFSQQLLLSVHFVSDKLGAKGGEILKKWVQSPPKETITLLLFPAIDRAQQKSAWFTALQESATVIEAKPIAKKMLPEWIKQRLLKQQQSPTPDALHFIAEHVEGNLLAAHQEIQKLSLLNPPGDITLDMVRNCVGYATRFSVFDLAEAWMGKDAERLVRVLTELEAEGEASTLVLWAITDDIRKLIKLRQGLAQNRPMVELERELRLWGSKKTWAQSALKRLGIRRLMTALDQCAHIDCQIKGIEEGEPWQTIQRTLLQLTA